MVSKYMVLMIRPAALWVHFVEVETAEVSASPDALSRVGHPNPNAVEGPTSPPARATDRGNSQNGKGEKHAEARLEQRTDIPQDGEQETQSTPKECGATTESLQEDSAAPREARRQGAAGGGQEKDAAEKPSLLTPAFWGPSFRPSPACRQRPVQLIRTANRCNRR